MAESWRLHRGCDVAGLAPVGDGRLSDRMVLAFGRLHGQLRQFVLGHRLPADPSRGPFFGITSNSIFRRSSPRARSILRVLLDPPMRLHFAAKRFQGSVQDQRARPTCLC